MAVTTAEQNDESRRLANSRMTSRRRWTMRLLATIIDRGELTISVQLNLDHQSADLFAR